MSSKKNKSAIISKIFSALKRNKKARKRERKPEVSKIFAAYRFKSLLLSPTARMLSLGAIRRIHQGMEEDDLILQVLGKRKCQEVTHSTDCYYRMAVSPPAAQSCIQI